MNKFCYSHDIVLTPEKILEDMDLSIFFDKDLEKRDPKILKKLLANFNIFPGEFDYDKADISISFQTASQNKKKFTLPNISARYYDENDHLFSAFEVQPRNSTLLSLQGKIFEQLSFSTPTEYKEFLINEQFDPGISDDRSPFGEYPLTTSQIYPDTTSCIYFQGIEYDKNKKNAYDEMIQNTKNQILTDENEKVLKNMHDHTKQKKEMYITKNKHMCRLYYNGPLDFNNQSDEPSLSAAEIETIQNRIAELLSLNGSIQGLHIDSELLYVDPNRNDNEKFLEYAYAYLEQYKKIVLNKGYNSPKPIVDEQTKENIYGILNGSIDENIYCKLTIISEKPFSSLLTIKDKNLDFMKSLKK